MLLAASACSAFAVTCEELRASIEDRIRANGVANFSVTAVDVAASAPGKQVGTCDVGRKKIMYLREPPSSAAAAAAAASAPAGSARAAVITECADGRVVKDGACKK
jgi:hypothetical protein